MAKLRSGRNVGITLDPYMERLRNPSINYIYATPGYFRYSVRSPVDLLKFASIVQFDDQSEKASKLTGFFVGDLQSGKINWPEGDVQDLIDWLDSNKDLPPWLLAHFNRAKLIVDPVIFSHPFSSEHRGKKSKSGQISAGDASIQERDIPNAIKKIPENSDFGKVSQYFGERGFGFVRGLLLGNSSEVFFHIKTIKKVDAKLASRLSVTPSIEDFYFWFETEDTPKGKQVRTVLLPEKIRRGEVSDPTPLIARVEALWRDTTRPKASWLETATSDLVGQDRVSALMLERKRLEEEERGARERAFKEREARLAIEKERRQQQIDAKRARDQLEEEEFQALVSEMQLQDFSSSSQVSRYIVANQLGYKYRNISGVLQMELDGTVWDFKGGFPPNIYARLCDELSLSNNGTRARPGKFTSFDEIEERSRKK